MDATGQDTQKFETDINNVCEAFQKLQRAAYVNATEGKYPGDRDWEAHCAYLIEVTVELVSAVNACVMDRSRYAFTA